MVSLGKFLEYELDGDKVRVVPKPGSLHTLLDAVNAVQGSLETGFDAVVLGSVLMGSGSAIVVEQLGKDDATAMLKICSELGVRLGANLMKEDEAAKPQGDA